MADRAITGHTEITASQVHDDDVLEIVDLSDTTDAPSGTNKKMKASQARSLFGVFCDKSRGAATNRWQFPSDNLTALGSVAATINVLRAVPFPVRFPTRIDRLGCQVLTGTTGKIRIFIYADDGNGYPGTLVAQSGELLVTTPAIYYGAIDVTLQPGLYWFGFITDTANSHLSFLNGNTSGYYQGIGLNSSASSSYVIQASQTYGALPDPFPAGATYPQANMNVLPIYRVIP